MCIRDRRCVANRNSTVREARPLFGDEKLEGKIRVHALCATTNTRVHAGGASGRKGGRSWLKVKVVVGDRVVMLIPFIP